MTSPFAFTEEELKMMQPDYKKPKAKKWCRVASCHNMSSYIVMPCALCEMFFRFGVKKKTSVERNTLHER